MLSWVWLGSGYDASVVTGIGGETALTVLRELCMVAEQLSTGSVNSF